MIFKRYKCSCCKTRTNKARPVKSYILCNDCNMKLNKEEILYFTEYKGLKFNGEKTVTLMGGQKMDFIIIEEFEIEKPSFWERRRQAREQAQMDNQSMVEWDCHESY
jgi:hypothetical protein